MRAALEVNAPRFGVVEQEVSGLKSQVAERELKASGEICTLELKDASQVFG